MKSNKIGLEWAEKNFKGFEVLISTHKDKGHIHNHFIVNSVSFENREKERDTISDNREDKRIEDKQRSIEREHRGRTRDLSR
ncbi:relaxase/mobilization nuclease domain-containing protein [Clostridium sporogenes]|uniref:relaxase/mobilization nuclease domain-containing protein n=1 Tax=Clostridium sporogenes TaxID=1509 RepID=UPI003F91AE53